MTSKFSILQKGIFSSKSKFPSVDDDDISFLKTQALSSPNKRSRICAHPDENDAQQEMFISFDGTSYIQPSRHKVDESFHLIEGRGKYIFFDKNGKYDFDVRLGDYNSDLPFYLRVPSDLYHTLIPLSKNIVAHEIVGGKFDRANTIFPKWSKDQKNIDTKKFIENYSYKPVSPLKEVSMKRISEEAIQCTDRLVYLSKKEIDYIKSEMPKTKRKRLRILVHPDVNHAMHEMFVVYSNDTFVQVNKHLGKDESLHILEGEATFVFFDDNGKIINVTELSSRENNKNFFIRVPRNIFHTIIMRSPEIVIHETTPGPFDRNDTIWAPWCPSDQDKKESTKFQKELEKNIVKFKQTNG